jgi:phage-related protein
MDIFTYVPSSATQGETTPRVLRAQFGDGYMQETGDGINAMLRNWDLIFDPIHATTGTVPTLQMLHAFLSAQKGYLKFQWTQPPPYDTEGPQYFICPMWTFTYQSGLITGLRARFEQRPL